MRLKENNNSVRQWLQDHFALFLSVYFAFTVAYSLGYISALGTNAFNFLDPMSISSLVFQSSLAFFFGWAVVVLFVRLINNEVDRNQSTFDIIASNGSARFFALLVLFTVAMGEFLSPDHLFPNIWFPISAITLYYFSFWNNGRSRNGPITRIIRFFRIVRNRPKLGTSLFEKDFRKFMNLNAAVIVFFISSWMGYSRAEFLSSEQVILLNGTEEIDLGIAPVLFSSGAVVFVNNNGDLYRLENVNYVQKNSRKKK